MLAVRGSAGALGKNALPLQQSYLGIANYLRGTRVAPRYIPRCGLDARKRFHAKRLLSQQADATPQVPSFLEEYKNNSTNERPLTEDGCGGLTMYGAYSIFPSCYDELESSP